MTGKRLPDDPFGFLSDNSAAANPGRAIPPAAAPTPAKPAAPAPSGLGGQSLAQVLGLAGFNGMVPGFSTDTYGRVIPPGSSGPPTVKAFDVNTDPTFQEANALIGKSDEEASAAALHQRQNTLLSYGDPSLASAVLGASDPNVEAAAQNPTSTLAGLADQRTRNLHDLTEGLNKDNLLYSGYRVTQEGQAAHDYQNALATAAANVNSSLGGIDSSLAGALSANQASRVQALMAAAALHAQDPGAAIDPGSGAGTTPPPSADSGVLNTGTAAAEPSLAELMALARARRTAVNA